MKSKIKYIIILVILANLLIVSITFAASGAKMIEVLLNYVSLKVNGEVVEVDNIAYNGTTYAPVRAVAEILGKEVGWDGSSNTVSINDSQPFTVGDDFVLHGFYALGAYDQYSDFYRSRTLSNFDSVSFGWSEIGEKNGKVRLLLSGQDSTDFYVPSGYNEALDTAKEHEISKQLMVFADDDFDKIFRSNQALIEQISQAVDGQNQSYSMLEFDGVTIDFEFVSKENQEDFIDFLEQLKDRLGKKKLYVAVPSMSNYEYYMIEEIISIVDYIILMEHDFDDKQLQPGYAGDRVVKTPLSPIEKVEVDINTIVSRAGEDNLHKILLQISFDSTQWGVKNGYLYSDSSGQTIRPSNPTYSQIYDKINGEMKEKSLELSDLIYYDEVFQNPYMKYYNNDKAVQYYIWYENSQSVLEKVKLAERYDLAGISLWRIGLIPNYYGPNGEEIGFDIWNKVNDWLNR